MSGAIPLLLHTHSLRAVVKASCFKVSISMNKTTELIHSDIIPGACVGFRT